MVDRSRRRFVHGALLATAATTLSRPARGEEGKPRALIVGASSMLGALGREIEDALKAAGFATRRTTRGSSGLSRPDFFDWPKVGAKAYREHEPDVVIVNFGGNDAQGLKMPDRHDPPWIRWPESGWSAEYGRRVVQFANVVAPQGEHLFWVGMPPMRSPSFDARVRKINKIVRTSLEGRPGGHYVDVRPIMSKGGAYSDSVRVDGVERRVREPDGVHINRAGGRHVASVLLPKIKKALQEQPEPPIPLGSLVRLLFTPRPR
jgi:hypothetical protein